MKAAVASHTATTSINVVTEDEPAPKVSKVLTETADIDEQQQEPPEIQNSENPPEVEIKDAEKACVNCVRLKAKNRQLSNTVKTLRGNLKNCKVEKRRYQRKGKQLNADCNYGNFYVDF